MELLDPEFWWPYGVGTIGVICLLVVLVLIRTARARAAAKPSTVRPRAPRARKPAGTQPPPVPLQVLILAKDEHAATLSEVLSECIRIKSVAELASRASRQRPSAVFVDLDMLPQLAGHLDLPIVGILDAATTKTLSTIVNVIGRYPKVTHLIAAPLLSTPLGRTHLRTLVDRLAGGAEHELLDSASVGRVAMLTQSSRRTARFERMHDYFAKQGMSSRTITAIYEVAEELVMNALYNAPSEAGFFKAPISRMEEVTLPPDRACEISYGIEGGNAFVRLRDTFGALRHERLLEVLARCNKQGSVALDESRGGAGLGVWRVLQAATTIAITVIPGRLTDILIRMTPKQGKSAKQLLALDLFFLPDSDKKNDALLLSQDDSLIDHSIMITKN